MADAPKPQAITEETVFLRNESGAVHDVDQAHPGVAAAARAQGGWRFASNDEIKAYAKIHNLEDPDLAALSKRCAALRKAAGQEDEAAAPPPAPSAEEAGLAPVEEPKVAAKPTVEPRVATAAEERGATASEKTGARS